MSRKGKIEPVRRYLNGERSKIIVEINNAVQSEDFIQAEQLKEFRQILSVAIQLCGEEKPQWQTSDAPRGGENKKNNE